MAGGDAKTNDTKAASAKQYQFAQKPEEKPGWEGFKQFVWNTETSEFLGRTGSSWCKFFEFFLLLMHSGIFDKSSLHFETFETF